MERDRISPTRRGISLPLWLDSLAARVARWPWWAVIIGVLLVIAFYSIATSELYRRVLTFVTNNPELTTNRYTRAVYDVKDANGNTSQVSGIISGEDAKTVTVITQDEVRVSIPREDIASIRCDKPDAAGNCPLNQPVSVNRTSIDGTLLFEDVGRYRIRTALGETVDVFKIGIARTSDNKLAETRTPPGCMPDPEGTCAVKLQLKADDERNQISGQLVESTPARLVVQTQPQITVSVEKASIVHAETTPAQCALNNLAGCNQGIFLTIGITFLAYALAIVLGLIFGLMRVSSNPVFFNLSTVYVEIVRGVPLLVILLFANYAFAPWFRDQFPALAPALQIIVGVGGAALVVYYILTRWGQRATEPVEFFQPVVVTVIFAVVLLIAVDFLRTHSNLDLVQRGVLGLAFGYGAFTAELFRAGIQSIGRGQMEAARSLGMSYVQAMRYVILPQAFRVILPPLGNDFIAMLKDTSLVAIIALPELTQMARLFASSTYRPFESYVTIGVLYLCMTLFLSFMVRVIERRTSPPR